MSRVALGIIDAQRGFMPAEEGIRLGLEGFGELPVAEGEQIIRPVNLLLRAFADKGLDAFTTQDWHPRDTAHFADEPNFTTTWPVHCVQNTPGAELHPDLAVDTKTLHFLKGYEKLVRGEDDTSYSGYYSSGRVGGGTTLPEFFEYSGTTGVVLGGLALDYCVGKSALDFREKLGMDVTVAIDATRGIAEPSMNEMLRQFARAGIRTASSEEIIAEL